MVQRPPEQPKETPEQPQITPETSLNTQEQYPPVTHEQAPPTVESAPPQTREYSQEIEPQPEQGTTEQDSTESGLSAMKRKLFSSKKQKNTVIPQVRDELTVQVENIMSFGLEDAFKALTPVQQQEFKIKGEETAREIRSMFNRAHIKVKRIFKLLIEWLKVLPGINKFYLEQEAKIKTDKLVSLYKQHKHMK